MAELPSPGLRQEPSARRVWAPLLALGVVVAVVLILLLGRVPLEGFPELAASPDGDIPGTVAHVTREGGRHCLTLTPAGGGPVETVRCQADWIDLVGFTEDGNLVVRSYGVVGTQTLVLDPAGTVLQTRRDAPDRPLPPSAPQRSAHEDQQLSVDRPTAGHAVLRLTDEEGARVLLDIEGPRDYDLTGVQFSPDGRWVLVADNHDRLLVVAADGEPRPRTLVAGGDADTSTAAWFIPGNKTYTVDPDEA